MIASQWLDAAQRELVRDDSERTGLPLTRPLFPVAYRYCRILGFTTAYKTSVSRLTAIYVSPMARMQPCTRK